MCIGEADLTVGPLVKKLLAGERPYNLAVYQNLINRLSQKFCSGSNDHDLDRIEPPKYEWTGYLFTEIIMTIS